MSKRTLEPPFLGIMAAYFILFTLALWPVIDFLVTALPLQMGRIEWRYASLGLMAMYLTTPIMGIGLAMVLAFFLRQPILLRILSVLSVLGGGFLLLAVLALSLDAIQLWGVAFPEGAPSVRAGALITGAKQLAGVLSLFLLGAGGWQASSRIPEQVPGQGADKRTRWLGAKTQRAEEVNT